MTKKLFLIFLSVVLVLSMVGCGNTDPNATTPTDEKGYWYKNDNIAINNFIALKLDFYEFQVTDEDLQIYLNYYILAPNADYKEIREGTLKMDDYLNVIITTKDEEGNIIEEYTTDENGYMLYIGLGDYIHGLDAGLIGCEVGQTIRFNTPLTIDGKTINATVEATPVYIVEMTYPEPTDEMAKKAGWASLEAFKEEQRTKLEEEYAKEAYDVFLENAKEAIIVEVYNHPEEMVESYMTKYREALAFYAAMYGLTEEEYLKNYVQLSRDEWEAQSREQALKDVETELMLGAILESLGLSLTDDAYKAYLDRMAEGAGYKSGASLEADMKEQGALSELKRELTMNYAYDMLLTYTNLRLIDWNTGNVLVDYVEQAE